MPDARPSGLRGRLPVKPVGKRYAIQYLGDYLAKALPAPKYPVDESYGITNWKMLGNGPDPTLSVNKGNPVGDCTFAGWQHLRMAKCRANNKTEVWESTDMLVTEYLDYNQGLDQGANLADVLLMWYRTYRVLGFAPVDHTKPEQCDAIMDAFHGLYVGVNLTPDADVLFGNHQPWTVAQGQKPDPNEGHCIVKIKADGPTGNKLDTYITWGALQQATQAWSAACVEEAWAVITTEDEAAKLDMPALQADLNALGGNRGDNSGLH
jgi:hypothetical protein